MKNTILHSGNTFTKALIVAIVLFMTGSFSSLKAQIVVNESYKFTAGDRYTSVSVDTTNVTQGNSGSNVTWNFLNVTLLNDPFETVFIDPNQAPGNGHFPGATLAQQIDSTYIFAKEEGNSLYSVGMYSENVVVRVFSDLQKVFQYPFAYNNTFTDTYSSEMKTEDYIVTSNGTSTLTADAWGTLILPSATHTNSLRIKTVTENIDTIFFEGSTLVSTSVNTSYSWYVNGSKAPVFTISYIQTQFGTYKFASCVNSSSTGIVKLPTGVADKFTLDQNYPNPFNPTTKITFAITKPGIVTLKVYDMTGKEVAVLVNEFMNLGKYAADFDASALTSGTYFYKLESNGQTETKRMMLIK